MKPVRGLQAGVLSPPERATGAVARASWLAAFRERDLTASPADYLPELCLAASAAAAFLALVGVAVGLPSALQPRANMPVLAMCLILGLGSLAYATVRQRPSIATILLIAASSLAAKQIGLLLGYLVQYRSRGEPLFDPTLAACDRAFGFDWLALMRWLGDHPMIARTLGFCYEACDQQFLLCVILFTLTHRQRRLLTLTAASFLSLIVVHLVPLAFPAIGPFGFYHAQLLMPPGLRLDNAAESVAGVLAVRGGHVAARLSGPLVGTVTFPSYHAVMAVQFAWALCCFRRARVPVLALNGAILLASLPFGSHYLVDLIAGVLLGIASLAVVTGLAGSQCMRRYSATGPCVFSSTWRHMRACQPTPAKL